MPEVSKYNEYVKMFDSYMSYFHDVKSITPMVRELNRIKARYTDAILKYAIAMARCIRSTEVLKEFEKYLKFTGLITGNENFDGAEVPDRFALTPGLESLINDGKELSKKDVELFNKHLADFTSYAQVNLIIPQARVLKIAESDTVDGGVEVSTFYPTTRTIFIYDDNGVVNSSVSSEKITEELVGMLKKALYLLSSYETPIHSIYCCTLDGYSGIEDHWLWGTYKTGADGSHIIYLR